MTSTSPRKRPITKCANPRRSKLRSLRIPRPLCGRGIFRTAPLLLLFRTRPHRRPCAGRAASRAGNARRSKVRVAPFRFSSKTPPAYLLLLFRTRPHCGLVRVRGRPRRNGSGQGFGEGGRTGFLPQRGKRTRPGGRTASLDGGNGSVMGRKRSDRGNPTAPVIASRSEAIQQPIRFSGLPRG